ncbi:hypothetical protein B0T26DRAFT_756550 [Lasiosphaeria miniovina]|uniref:Uncharacterized protein n=1 Tax=Lasiosphaeria miniovina TaxID=1954250 RepID=A0AA39ZSS8_9PEZI|nr:uncharacterized protein B0T26DRAFT_756550 [Lasiosphaeria miniovina]KAK0702947.1 hypothetical protein B0T26DRAFT_756550 [Lasiosphaeria miniovina]
MSQAGKSEGLDISITMDNQLLEQLFISRIGSKKTSGGSSNNEFLVTPWHPHQSLTLAIEADAKVDESDKLKELEKNFDKC